MNASVAERLARSEVDLDMLPQLSPLEAEGFVEHHLLFAEEEWMSYEAAASLREHPAMRLWVPAHIHEAIHADRDLRDGVPLLGRSMAACVLARVQREFADVDAGSVATLDYTMAEISSEVKRSTTPALQQGLGKLAVDALLVQRGYLQSIA